MAYENYQNAYSFQQTEYHVTAYRDPEGGARPAFVVREFQDNRGPTLSLSREPLAQELAGGIGTTPDQVLWYEVGRDGRFHQYEFHAHQHTVRPYSGDLSYREYAAAERAGLRTPVEATSYTHSHHEVSRQDVEERVGMRLDVPESRAEWAARQSQEFQDWSHRTDWEVHQQTMQPEQ